MSSVKTIKNAIFTLIKEYSRVILKHKKIEVKSSQAGRQITPQSICVNLIIA